MNDNIREITRVNLADIPDMLRRTAEKVEEGQFGDPADLRTVLIVLHDKDGNTEVMSYGPASDYYYAVATLEIAKNCMVRNL